MIVIWFYTILLYLGRAGGLANQLELNTKNQLQDNPNNKIEINLNKEDQRLKQELDDLYALAVAHIQNHQIELQASNAADILRNLIETNATGLITSYTTCPRVVGSQGIYTIQASGFPNSFPVFCDAEIAGPGWIVIARRTNDKLNFYLNWQQYKQGFGDLKADFFIGLDKLHAITKSQAHELYIHLEDFEGESRYAQYDDFFIESENKWYAMTKLGKFTGDAGDSLSVNHKKNFSTYDRDNDQWDKNCAVQYAGPWWHVDCTYSNLFGLYLGEKIDKSVHWKGMMWYGWHGETYSFKTMQMMVRPKCTSSN